MHAAASRVLARIGLAAIASLLLAAMPTAACADDDLPGRVGRIADVAGELYLAPQDRPAEWAPIGLNYTVISGDNLWVAAGGRAEVDYGGGQFRLAGDTSIHLSRLDDSQLALFVAQGWLIVRIRSLEPGDAARVDAPNTQIHLTRVGLYRIEVTSDGGTTFVTVREGEARVALVQGVQQALPGQTVTVSGADPVAADVRYGFGEDGFDAWSADRDRYYERSAAAAYVSGEMIGYADLDRYGAWQQLPDYGPVWFPNEVATDWAPYSDGYWANVGGWGATWVDYAPWGYAPFHYGRWAWVGGRWGWCPGRRVARPHWAPALVAWQGGPAWGLSRAHGSPVYGWLPLGWRDPYLPHWRGCSDRCWSRYNHPYGVDARERPRVAPSTYANSRVPGAITAVSGETLAGARPVAGSRLRVPGNVAATAPVLGTPPPLAPRRAHPPAGRTGAGAPAAASTIAPLARSRPGTAAAPAGGTGAAAPIAPAPFGRAPAASTPGATTRGAPGAPAASAPRAPSRGTPYPALPPLATEPAGAAASARIAAPPAALPAATPATGGRVVASPPARPEARPAPAPAVPPSMQRGAPPAGAVAAPAGAGVPGVVAPGVPPAVPQQAVPRGAPMVVPPAVAPVAPPGGATAPAGPAPGHPATGAADAPQGGGQRGAPPPAPSWGGGRSR